MKNFIKEDFIKEDKLINLVFNNKIIIFLFILGIFLMTFGGFFLKKENNSVGGQKSVIENVVTEDYQKNIEKKLEEVLSRVEGVGKVKVMITFGSEEEVEPAFNTVEGETVTEEKDNEGGMRTVTEREVNKQVVLVNKENKSEALIVKKVIPEIKGVLIVAEGGESSEIVDRLTKAASTLLNIPVYKINILPYVKN
ncbi:MAG: stage III sporulation protein AG [Thermovenabulum sp.]|uniref:stage III sporulation protein AG n=1 Tax=Thermovenabulum sp. TaxID=3100335 RepID=UPI003C7B8CCD